MSEGAALELFVSSCAALGAEVYGRRQIPDKRAARSGFERLTHAVPRPVRRMARAGRQRGRRP